jgi:signal transduction histidine kinase
VIEYIKEASTEYKTQIEQLEERIGQLECQIAMLKGQELNILNSIPAFMLICNFDEKITFCNKPLYQLLAYEKEIQYQLELKNILTKSSLFQLRRNYKQIFQNTEPLYFNELNILDSKNNITPLFVAISKYYDNSEQLGFIGIGFPISNFRENEHRLEEEKKSLIKFISLIAHDLKNPFNSLIGFSTLLLENYDVYSDEKKKEYISLLYTASMQGLQLLNNLLEWSRVTSNTIQPVRLPFVINPIIEDTIRLLESNFSKKEITLCINLANNITVYADSNMIQTVIRNIVSNAIKFTPRKGKIEILLYQQNTYAIVEIKDNGTGMTQQQVNNLFKLTEKMPSKGTEGEKGSGLGLLICKEFMDLNKGKIEINSTQGKGSTFKIIIPTVEKNQ